MIPTTDEIDHITAEERRDLMGFCEKCEEWKAAPGSTCSTCGHVWSARNGLQLITRRTFDIDRAKKEAAKFLKSKKR
jgi:hypothetical protein